MKVGGSATNWHLVCKSVLLAWLMGDCGKKIKPFYFDDDKLRLLIRETQEQTKGRA